MGGEGGEEAAGGWGGWQAGEGEYCVCFNADTETDTVSTDLDAASIAARPLSQACVPYVVGKGRLDDD